MKPSGMGIFHFFTPRLALAALVGRDGWTPRLPQDDAENPIDPDWNALLQGSDELNLEWPGANIFDFRQAVFSAEGSNVVSLQRAERRTAAILTDLAQTPFVVSSCTDLFGEVKRGRRGSKGLLDGFGAQGWMVAFKGAGHDRLVSRRWLDHGPWAVLRDDDSDLTVVLFYDPDAPSAEVALAQSEPGHDRMGWSPTGG